MIGRTAQNGLEGVSSDPYSSGFALMDSVRGIQVATCPRLVELWIVFEDILV